MAQKKPPGAYAPIRQAHPPSTSDPRLGFWPKHGASELGFFSCVSVTRRTKIAFRGRAHWEKKGRRGNLANSPAAIFFKIFLDYLRVKSTAPDMGNLPLSDGTTRRQTKWQEYF